MYSFSKKKSSCVLLVILVAICLISGCAGADSTLKAHQSQMEGITENEYVIPKKPVDKHYIGAAWSKLYGPVEDQSIGDIPVKKEKSFNNMQQDFAFNAGFGLGGQMVGGGPQAQAGIERAKLQKAKMEGVEIITPVSLADIPFEPDVNYITEALRLANFSLKGGKANKAEIGGSAGFQIASGTALGQIGNKSVTGTEGEGLVVAYKLHTINKKTFTQTDSGAISLGLDKITDVPKSNLFVKARLQNIEAGSKKSLPRNLIWACERAEAKSRDMVAAWIIDLKSADPKRKSLAIAFPAYPQIEDCANYSGTIYSRIDPATDKIHRQKVTISILEADVTDTLKPDKWTARISILDESFKIKPVDPSDVK